MGYRTVIKRVIYLGSHFEHVRENNGVLEVSKFPKNVQPFDTSKLSDIRLHEGLYGAPDLFELFEEVEGHSMDDWGTGRDLTKEMVQKMIRLADQKMYEEDLIKFLVDFYDTMEDDANYEIELI